MSHYTETVSPRNGKIRVASDEPWYGFSVIIPEDDGTYSVAALAWADGQKHDAGAMEPLYQRTFIEALDTLGSARTFARIEADWRPAATRPAGRCHWCGLPTRRGYCEECGEQF